MASVDKKLVNYLTRTRTAAICELNQIDRDIDTLKGKRRAVSITIDGLSAQLAIAQSGQHQQRTATPGTERASNED